MITSKNRPHKMHWMWLTLFAGAAIFVCANPSSISAQTAGGRSAEVLEGHDVKVYSPGAQQVAIDPRTGRLRQLTPEEARALSQSLQGTLNRSKNGLTVVEHGNGAKSVNIKGRFLSLSLAKVNADGSVSTECVNTPTAAAKFTNAKSGTRVTNARGAHKKSAAQRSTRKARQTSR